MSPAPISSRLDLTGQVAFVTGAGGGIGSASVWALAREGAAVAVTSLVGEEAERLAADVRSSGGSAIAIELDVTDQAACRAAVERTVGELGRLDVAVSAAGIAAHAPLGEITDAEWEEVLGVNLKGTLHVLQAVYPVMAAAGYGKIVCIGSIAARQGGVVTGPHYVASKAGVHGMVKWLARAGAPRGVYVNAVAPGPVMTPMWRSGPDPSGAETAKLVPLGRIGEPEDIAEAVLFLASPMSNWITGLVLDVTGGLLMV